MDLVSRQTFIIILRVFFWLLFTYTLQIHTKYPVKLTIFPAYFNCDANDICDFGISEKYYSCSFFFFLFSLPFFLILRCQQVLGSKRDRRPTTNRRRLQNNEERKKNMMSYSQLCLCHEKQTSKWKKRRKKKLNTSHIWHFEEFWTHSRIFLSSFGRFASITISIRDATK